MTGPHPAYMDQIHDMIKKGDTSLDPRKKIFGDVEKYNRKEKKRI